MPISLATFRQLSAADLALIYAVQHHDVPAAQEALDKGAKPGTRKSYRGGIREPLTLVAVRRGQPDLLELLLEAGAPCEAGLVTATALLVERATQTGDPDLLNKARAIVNLLEERQVDWAVSDRMVGGGLRAIDLLASSQPEWAAAPTKRQNLTPLSTRETPTAPGQGRQRRQAT